MAFQIGQLRRSDITSYSTDITYNQGLIVNENSIIDFYDSCLYLEGTNVVSSLYSYYLRFEVTQLVDSAQDFTIILKNSELEEDNSQNIRTFKVKMGTGTSVFELIFNPNSDYNEIVFELSRLAIDFNMDNGDGTSGRIMDIKVLDFYLINNIVNTLSTLYPGLTNLKKIGLQGSPGLLFTLDGEEIRIGNSGIYELYNEEIAISYLGFVIKPSSGVLDGKDYFILDFRY